MKTQLFLACDHAAFEGKEALRSFLSDKYEVIDLGTYSTESVHYPDYAQKLCLEVTRTGMQGILLCGSGIGVSMVANRFQGIRAALCRDTEDAKMSRLHNDANVLCLGGRRNTIDELKNITDVFLTTAFEGGRHKMRVDLFNKLGQSC